jgi:hypothetical protein
MVRDGDTECEDGKVDGVMTRMTTDYTVYVKSGCEIEVKLTNDPQLTYYTVRIKDAGPGGTRVALILDPAEFHELAAMVLDAPSPEYVPGAKNA